MQLFATVSPDIAMGQSKLHPRGHFLGSLTALVLCGEGSGRVTQTCVLCRFFSSSE